MLRGGGARGRGVSVLVAAMAMSAAACSWVCPSLALGAGDVNTLTSCPLETESSPGFHSYLPDCRAFELVSPAFTNGQFPLGVYYKAEPPQISADGEHLLSVVLAGFAGSETLEQHGPNYGALYEFSRTPEGWGAEALAPPASLYPRSEFEFASSDFTRTLWSVQLPVAPGEELPLGTGNGATAPNNGMLVIREPAGGGKGRFVVVGPATAPGHTPSKEPPGLRSVFSPEGASADLSHILLRVTAELKQLWPGDATVESGQSLYEYAGTGEHEPVLVGVSNDGAVAEEAMREGKAYVNEAADLISRCGTHLGGSTGHDPEEEGPGAARRMENAVSASGEVVYFTASACGESPRVNELYARVDGEHTVDISEPSTGPNGDCALCPPELEPYSALYQGASEDGSRVFFTSEQELLPGASGNSLYEYNFDASDPHERVILIAPDVSEVAAVCQDGTRIYFESPAVLAGQVNGNGETASPGGQNLYMDDTSGAPAPVFVAQEASELSTTRDGQFLVFKSSQHIAGTDDESGIPQIFEYDTESGVNSRISVGQSSRSGYECEATHVVEERYGCDGNATSGSYYLPFPLAEQESGYWWPTDATSGLAVSAHGIVEFESTIALTPLAIPEHENVYEYRDGDVYLISPGTEAVSPVDAELLGSLSRLLGIDESGQDEFFATTESLVSEDTNSQTSWYDARVDGGFPAPAEAPSCTSGTCQGSPAAGPPLAALASATAAGGDNLAVSLPPASMLASTPSAKCKKRYVRKKGKCVKKPAAKAKKARSGKASDSTGVRS